MAEDPARVLKAVWAAWRAQDVPRIASYFSAAGVFEQNIPLDIWPWAGVTVGRAAIADRLARVLDHFDIVEYDGHVTSSNATVARGRVGCRLVHRQSGYELDGHVRHEATVRGGLIVHFEAFYDVERLRAFMRLVSAMA